MYRKKTEVTYQKWKKWQKKMCNEHVFLLILINRIWLRIRMQALVNLDPDVDFDVPESEYRL
jgi:hypothetical protein